MVSLCVHTNSQSLPVVMNKRLVEEGRTEIGSLVCVCGIIKFLFAECKDQGLRKRL